MFDSSRAYNEISRHFDESVIPTLVEYIRIPNLSPSFNGGKFDEPETEQAIALFASWVSAQSVAGLTLSIRRLPERTPLMYIEVPASADYTGSDSTLLYGHLDKQPPFEGWDEGTGPYIPVIKNGRLYGRGGADDGYALFGSLEAIKAIQSQGKPHARCVILIEACEESGSPDLPAHLASLIEEGKIGRVSLVVCLDSGAAGYDTFYMTTSIRGMLMTKLTVQTLTEGVHSGAGGGICADSFRVIRQLLSAIEDENTGDMADEFQVTVPSDRLAQNALTSARLGASVFQGFPLATGVPVTSDVAQLSLNRGWRASLTVTGMDGIPPCATGGNVLRPSTSVKLTIRLPPTYDHTKAFGILKEKMEAALPPTATMTLSPPVTAKGWNAPAMEPWLQAALEEATGRVFQDGPPGYIFEGGSIPFLGMLQDMFPMAQFCVTGVLGPHSNAHGPNEFLDIEYCKRVVSCVAGVVAGHGQRPAHAEQENQVPELAAAAARIAVAREDKLVHQKMCCP